MALTLPPAAPESVALHLAHPVKHDGTRYGPGEVTVTTELAETFRGLGIDEGLAILADVKKQIGVPVLTDVHAEDEVAQVAAVVDVLQTPAFLCRQTDFIQVVAAAGKPVNIKKGQFLAPGDMKQVVAKAKEANGNTDTIMVCEGGASYRLQQPRLRHAQPRHPARDRLSGGLRRHPFGAAAGRAVRLLRRPARVRAAAR